MSFTYRIRLLAIDTADFVRTLLVAYFRDYQIKFTFLFQSRRAVIYTEQKRSELKNASDSEWLLAVLKNPCLKNFVLIPVCLWVQCIVSLMLGSGSKQLVNDS